MSQIRACRSCQSKDLEEILNLGDTPLANALLKEEELEKNEKMYPLKLIWCSQCSLLQISENVPAEILFSHYFYRSSFSDAFLSHCKNLAEKVIDARKLDAHSLVIDIASNDGYLLQYYKEKGIPVLGIEPAENIASVATEKGIETKTEFFSHSLAKTLPKADVVHAHNVLPHVADQRDFVQGIKELLKPEGEAIIEFAYAIDTVDKTEFDQIYHEHMCYFSLFSFKKLVEQFGLVITDVEKIDMHGGSLRVHLGHEGSDVQDSVNKLLQDESEWGVDSVKPYKSFAARTRELKIELVTLLEKLRIDGKKIAAYGASAKGCTLMHFCSLGDDLLYVVDRSTVKQGHYTPGTHLKIEPVEKLTEDMPDYVLLLTWNFVDEILKQQKEYREKGGQFIVPLPRPKIV